jgi:large subunit ribosomal protein LX
MIMEDSRFEVKGTFMVGREWHPYTKVIEAPNDAQARERTLAVIGSKHRLKRRYITITAVSVLPGE